MSLNLSEDQSCNSPYSYSYSSEEEPKNKKPKTEISPSLEQTRQNAASITNPNKKRFRLLKMKKLPERECSKGFTTPPQTNRKFLNPLHSFHPFTYSSFYINTIEGDPLPPGYISYTVSHGNNNCDNFH
jgi:hypothetical protein